MSKTTNPLILTGSGLTPAAVADVAECFAGLLNTGLHPVMPSIGSIGAR